MEIIHFSNKEIALQLKFSDSICIWDTDSFGISEELVDKLVEGHCLCLLSVGSRSDELHNLCDASVEEYEVFNRKSVDIDTRGGEITKYNLKDALWEAKHNMFPEVESKSRVIYVFSSDEIARKGALC